MRIRQHDRPNDPGRMFFFSVCVYTSVCVCMCCMYLSLCLPLPGSDMCMQTHCLEGDMTKKLPEAFERSVFCFFSFSSSSSCVAPLGKVKSKQRGDARSIVLDSIAGLLSQTCLLYFSYSSFSATLINGILGASQESTKS